MALNKRALAIDFDDCLINFNSSLLKFHNQNYNTALTWDDTISFDLSEVFKCDINECDRRVREFHGFSTHETFDLIEDAVEAITLLSQQYELHIITSRPVETREKAHTIVDINFAGRFERMHFTEDHRHVYQSLSLAKAMLCEELNAAALIDDGLHNAEKAVEYGIPVYLMDKPWNQGETVSGITRVYSWQEILRHLKVPVTA
jgi:uncharacterized HAD superfamily protein